MDHAQYLPRLGQLRTLLRRRGGLRRYRPAHLEHGCPGVGAQARGRRTRGQPAQGGGGGGVFRAKLRHAHHGATGAALWLRADRGCLPRGGRVLCRAAGGLRRIRGDDGVQLSSGENHHQRRGRHGPDQQPATGGPSAPLAQPRHDPRPGANDRAQPRPLVLPADRAGFQLPHHRSAGGPGLVPAGQARRFHCPAPATGGSL